MDDLRELYQEVILDHNKNPKNYGELPSCNHCSEGYNPLCGDRVKIYLLVEDGLIKEVRFTGNGCAISKASASVMTTLLKGKTVAEAEQLFKKFQKMVTQHPQSDEKIEDLDKMIVFAGVREFPTRIKCASLPWHTMLAALQSKNETISTE